MIGAAHVSTTRDIQAARLDLFAAQGLGRFEMPLKVTTARQRTAGTREAWSGPNRKQRAYICRLCLELLGIPYPADEQEASRVIDRLKRGVENAQVSAGVEDTCPF